MTRHRFDPFSALAGVLSLAMAIAIGARTGPVGIAELQLVGPLAILVLGVALVAGGGRSPDAAELAATSSPDPAPGVGRDDDPGDTSTTVGSDPAGGGDADAPDASDVPDASDAPDASDGAPDDDPAHGGA